MKKIFTLLVALISLGLSSVKANENQPRGIDLGEYAFGIPVEQLSFNISSTFTISFWMNVKEFNHLSSGTQFLNIRDISDGWPASDWGYMWSEIGYSYKENFENKVQMTIRDCMSEGTSSKELSPVEINSSEWKHISFVFDYDDYRKLTLYIDGVAPYKLGMTVCTYSWQSNFIIMIGGPAFYRAPLNAYIDKVQFYNKALSEAEVKESMIAPLNDTSLLGYWDFEEGCTTNADGFMVADNGTIKATMYKIIQQGEGSYEGATLGQEIQPFTYGKGVNPESVLQGVKASTAEECKTKAYVSNGVLYIENAESINSVEVYDAMGREIPPLNWEKDEDEAQISLPSALKGVLLVKVNNEVVKVICE